MQVDAPMTSDIATLFASATKGAKIQLPPGRHVVKEPIVLTQSITVSGAPDGSTVLDGGGQDTILMLLGNEHTYAFATLTFQSGAGAIAAPNRNRIAFEGCRFADNASEAAGAAGVLHHAQGYFRRCIFERNTSLCGGALAVGTGCDLMLDCCLFVSNEAEAGGAVFLDDTGAIEIRSCTFVKNRATRAECGNALFLFGTSTEGPSTFIANSIFAGDGAISGDPGDDGTLFLTHSVIPGDVFPRKGYRDLGTNTVGGIELVELEQGLGLVALAPGSRAFGTADVKRIAPSAVDILGRPLVRDGRASPGALAPP
jgi:hypothetical protein